MITKEQLSIFTGKALAEKYYQAVVDECKKGNITGKLRVCAFLAQILHESGGLRYSKELTGYTPELMMKVWPSKFPTLERAKAYEKQPEKLFNYVYGGRMGNNNEGDGYRYIGRGFIGTTGKANYQQLTTDTGIDFVSHPELLEQPHYAIMSAVNFWNKYKLNEKADTGDFKGITQRINGGQIGAPDREAKYKKLLEIYPA